MAALQAVQDKKQQDLPTGQMEAIPIPLRFIGKPHLHVGWTDYPAEVFTTEAGNGNSLSAFSGTHLAHPFLSILDAWVTHRPGFTSEAQALQAWPETWVR